MKEQTSSEYVHFLTAKGHSQSCGTSQKPTNHVFVSMNLESESLALKYNVLNFQRTKKAIMAIRQLAQG